MSVNLSFENDDGVETISSDDLILFVSKESDEILVEVFEESNEGKKYCEKSLLPESFGLRDEPSIDSELTEIRKVFSANPQQIVINVDCHPDGLLIEVVGEFEVITFYRINFSEWGFEVGKGKSVIFD